MQDLKKELIDTRASNLWRHIKYVVMMECNEVCSKKIGRSKRDICLCVYIYIYTPLHIHLYICVYAFCGPRESL